jgi:hypothetical protein
MPKISQLEKTISNGLNNRRKYKTNEKRFENMLLVPHPTIKKQYIYIPNPNLEHIMQKQNNASETEVTISEHHNFTKNLTRKIK